jgi:Predicted GTPase
LLNKTDLPMQLDRDQLRTYVDDDHVIETSIVHNAGMDQLADKINHLFFEEGIESNQNSVMVTNARHIGLLHQASDALNDVQMGIAAGMPVDLVQIDMTRCWDLLGEITGDSYQDELLDQLFSQFCLGK